MSRILGIIANNAIPEIETALSEYAKEDGKGKSRLDKDLGKIKPYLKPEDRLLNLIISIAASLGIKTLSEASEGNINKKGEPLLATVNEVKRQIANKFNERLS